MQRLRGSERDLKLNVNVPMSLPKEDRTESLPTIKVLVLELIAYIFFKFKIFALNWC
jgi:hypothetical protein